MSVIGHQTARMILQRDLPQACLLSGPPSVGKWTLANHVADFHRVAAVDHWRIPDGLTIDTVRLITAFAHRAPISQFKLIQARLDNSSEPALNALLKTLEEPPPRVKFLLVTSTATLPTVISRCVVFRLGLLSPEELTRIYLREGLSLVKARRAAAYARGQVSAGYTMDNTGDPRTQAAGVARAIRVGDPGLFDAVFKNWDARSTQLLVTLLSECLTGRWSLYTEEDAAGLHHDRKQIMAMLTALARLPSARPRLRVRAALEPFVARR